MTILSRSMGNVDLYRLKGRLDKPALAQLQFILTRLSGTKPMQFDFRLVSNMGEDSAVDSLQNMLASVPEGTNLVFSGVPLNARYVYSEAGVPQGVFI
jgi:hypothetical protein